jgi:trans-feruloyl-CoA hydratase/vanillin synthase
VPAFATAPRSVLADGVDYEAILVSIDPATRVAVVTFNRPDKRNAMSPRMTEEMDDVLERLRADDRVGALVLTGAGKAFCAGMDLKEFFLALNDKPQEMERIQRMSCDWRGRTLRYYPKATIAMINGFCFGAAFSTVEGCDLAFAAETAQFGLSEINFGLFPGGPVSKSMANLLRPRDALYYGMTGKPFDAKRAESIGFINAAIPDADLTAEVMTLAAELAAKDPYAMRATKETYRHSIGMEWDAAVDYAIVRQHAITYQQSGAWMDTGIGDFLKGDYKPGLESNTNLGTRS